MAEEAVPDDSRCRNDDRPGRHHDRSAAAEAVDRDRVSAPVDTHLCALPEFCVRCQRDWPPRVARREAEQKGESATAIGGVVMVFSVWGAATDGKQCQDAGWSVMRPYAALT